MLSSIVESVRRVLPGGQPLLLNLGCGARFHPAWVNVDVMAHAPEIKVHDLRDPLPFGNNRSSAIYCSHVLEHFTRDAAPVFLRECHRVLQPGGIIRVVVPDLETIARLYVKYLDGALVGDTQAEHRHEWMTLELLDQLVREQSGGSMLEYWKQNPMPAEDFVIERVGQEVRGVLDQLRPVGAPPPPPAPAPMKPDPQKVAVFRDGGEVHKWMYDRVSLRRLLHQCGFVEATVRAAAESQIPEFATYQLDTDEAGRTRKPDSLFMEACKPPKAGQEA